MTTPSSRPARHKRRAILVSCIDDDTIGGRYKTSGHAKSNALVL